MTKTKKPDKENPKLLELGQKQRAGRMMSEYLRAIGTEVSEVILDDSVSPGPPRLVSKAEALARWLWRQSLPSKDENGIYIPPNLDVVKIVLDRIEGKPSVGVEDPANIRESVPDKISKMNQERVNKISAEVTGEINA